MALLPTPLAHLRLGAVLAHVSLSNKKHEEKNANTKTILTNLLPAVAADVGELAVPGHVTFLLAFPASVGEFTVRGHVSLLLALEAGVRQLALVGLVPLLLALEALVRLGAVLGEVPFLTTLPAGAAIPSSV